MKGENIYHPLLIVVLLFLNLFKHWLQQCISLSVEHTKLAGAVVAEPCICQKSCFLYDLWQVQDQQLIWLKWFILRWCMMLLGKEVGNHFFHDWYSFKAFSRSLWIFSGKFVQIAFGRKSNGCSRISQIITPFNIACYTLMSCVSSTRLFFFFFGRQIHCSSVIPDFDDTLYAPLLPLSLS